MQHTISLREFATKESFKKLHLIIHQMSTLKTLLIFIKNVLQNHFRFYLLILLLHQIILHVSEKKFFKKNIKTNHDN